MKLKIETCILLINTLTTISLLSGCKHTPKNMTPDFGESYRVAFSKQVLNPDAPEDRGPVDSLSGNVGNQIYQKRYVKSLTEEKDEEDSVNKKLGDLD